MRRMSRQSKSYNVVRLAILLKCCRFPITWLNSLAFASLISMCNSHSSANNTHHKASLIKVVEITVHHTIFHLHILYQPEPHINKLWIFAQGPLKVINAIETRL